MPRTQTRKQKHRLRVHRSSAGLGLFTERPIKEGVLVIEYRGPLLTDEKADRKGGRYIFKIDEKWNIDGSPRTNLARYINHSCVPNCEAEIDGKRVYIYAKRAIKPGEELTYNYGKEYFDDVVKPEGCRCVRCAN